MLRTAIIRLQRLLFALAVNGKERVPIMIWCLLKIHCTSFSLSQSKPSIPSSILGLTKKVASELKDLILKGSLISPSVAISLPLAAVMVLSADFSRVGSIH